MTTATPTESELKQFIERVERLNEDESAIKDDRKEVFAEAKGRGYCVPTMREVIKRRKMDADDLAEKEAVLQLYEKALAR